MVDVAGQPYDFSSLMHYKNKEFSKNGLNTIEAKTNPRTIFGNDKGFSKIDILQINSVYNCPARYQRSKYVAHPRTYYLINRLHFSVRVYRL